MAERMNDSPTGGVRVRWSCISVLGILLVVTMSGPSAALMDAGTKEISFGGSFNTWAIEQEPSQTNLNLYARGGRVFTGRIGAEVECFFTSFHQKTPGFVLSGDATYNFSHETSSGLISIFLLAGAGVSNSLPFLGYVTWMSSSSRLDLVLNAGAGTRIPITGAVSARLEYRYQRYYADPGAHSHLVLIGMSILFGP